MAESINFTGLANVGELSLSAIMAIVQEQGGELVSLQASMAQVAELIAKGTEYNELTTEQKTLIAAINEIAAGGGGGGGGAYFFNAGEATAAQIRGKYNNGLMCFLVASDGTIYPLTAVDSEYIQSELVPGVFFAKAFGYDGEINVTIKYIEDDAGTEVKSLTITGVPKSQITNDMSETNGKIPTDNAVRSYVTNYITGQLNAKADTSLENINEAGEQKIRDIAGGGGGGGGSVVDITPILTADSDQVITNAPTFYNGKFKWFVFKSDVNDYAYPDEVPSPKLAYIGYDFLEPQSVVAVKVRYIPESNNITNLKVIASNDGETWEDLTPVENIGGGNTNYWYTFLFGAPKTFRMFAVQFGEYRNYAKLGSIRFMGMKTPPVDVQINGTSIVDSNNVANIPYATTTKGGVIKNYSGYAMWISSDNGIPYAIQRTQSQYNSDNVNAFIGKGTLENIKTDVVRRALTDNTQADWTESEKASARSRIGASGNIIQYVDVSVPSKMYVSVAAAAGVPINGVLNVLGLGTEDIAQASIVDARPASFTLCITVSSPMNVRIYYY